MENKLKKPRVKQPAQCKGCVWGRWEAPVQFCFKIIECEKGAYPKVGDPIERRPTDP
ncbi:hypothetical protein PMJ11TS3_03070 [Paenibacillus melissococcoides]